MSSEDKARMNARIVVMSSGRGGTRYFSFPLVRVVSPDDLSSCPIPTKQTSRICLQPQACSSPVTFRTMVRNSKCPEARAILISGLLLQPSNKTFRTKIKLAKAMKQNRPIPQWFRLKRDTNIQVGANILCWMAWPLTLRRSP